MPFDKQTASEAGKKSKRGPSATTTEVKQIITNLVEKLQTDIFDNLNKLEPKEKADLLTKLIEYVIPKQRYQVEEHKETIQTNTDPLQVYRDILGNCNDCQEK